MERKARRQLAQKLRLMRFLRSWSQEDLAGASGLHRTYISALERGTCNAGLDNIERLADAFGVSIQDLLGEPDASLLSKILASENDNR